MKGKGEQAWGDIKDAARNLKDDLRQKLANQYLISEVSQNAPGQLPARLTSLSPLN